VYQIRNRKDSKVYIGVTRNLSKRWGEHRAALRSDRHVNARLQQAWNQDGEDSFEFETLEFVLKPGAGAEREKHHLDLSQASDPAYGYNLRSALDQRFDTYTHSEETREKLRNAHLGRPLTEDHRASIREAKLRQYAEHPVTQDTREKMSQGRRGKGKGRPVTEDVRRRISEGQRLYRREKRGGDDVPCRNCQAVSKRPMSFGLCNNCYDYFRRVGVERPASVYTPTSPPCSNCGVALTRRKLGRCETCYSYFKRVGTERPESLYSQSSPDQELLDSGGHPGAETPSAGSPDPARSPALPVDERPLRTSEE
jgi:group I intron endonuclease